MISETNKDNELFWVDACPCCCSEDWKDLGLSQAKGRFYQAYLELGSDVESMGFVRCQSCGSVWRRPWIQSRAQAPAYASLAPQHGWGQPCFQRGSVTRRGHARLHDFFVKHLKSFERYGKVGYPIWGLLAYYGRTRYRA